MGKRIVGYVISHSGKPGGPWECEVGRNGAGTTDPRRRLNYVHRAVAQNYLSDVTRIHPAARILRLVRRERHRAEEAAVVEAAMAVPSDARDEPQYWLALSSLDNALAALRAKRGG